MTSNEADAENDSGVYTFVKGLEFFSVGTNWIAAKVFYGLVFSWVRLLVYVGSDGAGGERSGRLGRRGPRARAWFPSKCCGRAYVIDWSTDFMALVFNIKIHTRKPKQTGLVC